MNSISIQRTRLTAGSDVIVDLIVEGSRASAEVSKSAQFAPKADGSGYGRFWGPIRTIINGGNARDFEELRVFHNMVEVVMREAEALDAEFPTGTECEKAT